MTKGIQRLKKAPTASDDNVDTAKSIVEHSLRITAVSTVVLVALSAPVAASHSTLPCPVPPPLEPLFNLLDTFTQLAFISGVSLGLLGFTIAGVFFVIPGEEWTRRGKQLSRNVLYGTILLLSANMIVSFLVSELGTTVCT